MEGQIGIFNVGIATRLLSELVNTEIKPVKLLKIDFVSYLAH